MTIRQEMINSCSRAEKHLKDSVHTVIQFLVDRMDTSGGFHGRDGRCDLYYTVFGLETLIALNADYDKKLARAYIETFKNPEDLDFIHLACLIRCWADVTDANIPQDHCDLFSKRLDAFRSVDGGYCNVAYSEKGTAYDSFLGLAACQDLGIDLSKPELMISSLQSLRKDNGAFANDSFIESGSVPATAAAISSLYHLGCDPDYLSVDWMLKHCRSTGGFVAMDLSPIPDLLSTATAIHSLSVAGVNIDKIRKCCIEFVDSLWDIEGGFTANWLEDELDCEYTYYGLLALGHL